MTCVLDQLDGNGLQGKFFPACFASRVQHHLSLHVRAFILSIAYSFILKFFEHCLLYFQFQPVELNREEFTEHYTKQRATLYPSDEYFIAAVQRCLECLKTEHAQ